MRIHTLGKSERLKSKSLIAKVFSEGFSLNKYPLKVYILKLDPSQAKHPVLMGVSVPKRNFKKSTDRNILKRRIRESYRIRKKDLYQILRNRDNSFAIMFVFIAKKIEDYYFIDKSLAYLMQAMGNNG